MHPNKELSERFNVFSKKIHDIEHIVRNSGIFSLRSKLYEVLNRDYTKK